MAADVLYGPCAGDLARPEVLHKQAALRVGPQRPIQIVAGAYVVDGKVQRSNKARVIRDGIVVHTGQINALKRFKDDVKEVGTNFECGISLVNYNDLREGDMIETYQEVEVKAKL